jgi:hypothetical protein
VGGQAWNWEGLLVKHKEYMVDRLNDEIQMLRSEKVRLQMDYQHQERERAAGEIVLCLIMFAAGFAAGWALV